jgi:hypothetical protein
MPIFTRDAVIDAEVDALAARQPTRTSKTAMVEAILLRVCRHCRTDPQAWLQIGTDPSGNEAADGPGDTADSHASNGVSHSPTRAPAATNVEAPPIARAG